MTRDEATLLFLSTFDQAASSTTAWYEHRQPVGPDD